MGRACPCRACPTYNHIILNYLYSLQEIAVEARGCGVVPLNISGFLYLPPPVPVRPCPVRVRPFRPLGPLRPLGPFPPPCSSSSSVKVSLARPNLRTLPLSPFRDIPRNGAVAFILPPFSLRAAAISVRS